MLILFLVGSNAEIIQIAAVCGADKLNVYTIPTYIPEKASKIHNLIMINGDLFCKGERVVTVPLKAALQEFLSFMSRIRSF